MNYSLKRTDMHCSAAGIAARQLTHSLLKFDSVLMRTSIAISSAVPMLTLQGDDTAVSRCWQVNSKLDLLDGPSDQLATKATAEHAAL